MERTLVLLQEVITSKRVSLIMKVVTPITLREMKPVGSDTTKGTMQAIKIVEGKAGLIEVTEVADITMLTTLQTEEVFMLTKAMVIVREPIQVTRM